MDEIMTLDFLKGSALVAFVIGFWDKIKTFLWMILSTFIQKIEIKSEEAHETIIAHLITNYKKLPSHNKVYSTQYESFRNGKFGLVPFEKFGAASIVFLTHKKYWGFLKLPFFYSVNGGPAIGNQDHAGAVQQDTEKTYSSILCLRGSIQSDKLVEEAILYRNRISWQDSAEEETSNRFDIFYFPEREQNGNERGHYNAGLPWYKQYQNKLLGVSAGDLGRERKSNGSALDHLFFPESVTNLIDIIRLWVKSKDWYKLKNIPWKRGWLLYGPPGTGKTALARAFAEDLDMPVYFFSLAQMSNSDLIKAWQSMQLNIPCIALIEDIDNVFDKRQNICQSNIGFSNFFDKKHDSDESQNIGSKTPLTFDTLLNCIDGVDKSDGVFTIITTNDISKIDPAIGVPKTLEDGTQTFVSSRPGRIDKAIELTYMDIANKENMAAKILEDFPGKLAEIQTHIQKNIEETPAQFQEYCSQIALQEYWKNNDLETKTTPVH